MWQRQSRRAGISRRKKKRWDTSCHRCEVRTRGSAFAAPHEASMRLSQILVTAHHDRRIDGSIRGERDQVQNDEPVNALLAAGIDPAQPELDPASYGFSEADLDRPIFLDKVLGLEQATIHQIIDILKRTYCHTLGVEFMHISDPVQKAWLQQRIEGADKEISFTPEGKKSILRNLIEGDVSVAGESLKSGDGLAIEDVEALELKTSDGAQFLLFDLK